MTDHERDLQAEELADLARRVEAALEVEAPEARREKTLFVAGAGAHRRTAPWLGAFAPAAAVVGILVVLALVSRTALPGQTLYPVREVLGNVGLAPSTGKEVREHLDRAGALIAEAAASASTEPVRARALVREAWGALDDADELVDEMDGTRRDAFRDEIEALEERGEAAEEIAEEALEERERGREDEEEDDDSSGSGSGSGSDDSSGSGSGDDDSSGSGSGSDDDSSGSGSGSDDDSSGKGSGSDD